jgi:protein arginine kinase activator
MKCECCHQKEATIHLTQVIESETKKLNLCQECALESGIDLNSPISITDVLLGLGAQPQTLDRSAETAFDLSCSRCQMTRTEFKKRARVGCPECYNAFMGELNALTKAMHPGNQHIGKIPARQGNEARITAQVAALQKDIETAIAKEQYEMAANIRDKIRALQGSASSLETGEPHDA